MLGTKTIFSVLLFFLILTAAHADLLKNANTSEIEIFDIRFDRTYRPTEINALASKLFESVKPSPARYSVDVYYIRFTSRYLDGSEAPITAQVFIPRFAQRTVRPSYIFAPGSTGLLDACRPSREHVLGIKWGLYRTHVLAFAGQGVIGMLPDYTGFGDQERLQPYYVAKAEAMMMLDAVRALHTFFRQEITAVQPHHAAFLAGYSQGGHAIFAAADYRDEYAPDVDIAGLIGYGPARGLEDLFREFTVSAPLVIYTYMRLYGREQFDPALILQDRWAERLEQDVTRMCIGGIQDYYPRDPALLYRPQFNAALQDGSLPDVYPRIARLLRENSTGLSKHGIPVMILQGTNDVVVRHRTQTDFVSRLRERGSEVDYIIYKGSRHDTRQISFDSVLRWMETKVPEE